MARLATTLTAAAIATAHPANAEEGYRGYETPRYTVAATAGVVEVRDYAPALMAQVTVEAEQSAALRAGFRILAGYIFGGNVSADKIAMTSPVTQTSSEKIAMTAPVTQTGDNGNWTVSFMMPGSYTLDTLPIPNNSAVQFVETEPVRKAVIRYSGWATANQRARQEAILRDWASAAGIGLTGPAEFAYYDDPMTAPWRRRNEIAIVVSSMPEG
ncbi:MAG: heme-binding protein [Pseudomonadota bacterium]